ncbi:signal peptidase II [Calidifontibacter terrae]
MIAVAIVGYALDQVTKWWAANSLDPMQPREVLGSLLQLHLTFNPGAAFSIGTNATWVLTLIACVVIAATIYFARRLHSAGWALGLGLLIGGALGNLTDRFFRSPGGGKGHVVDFLELPHWPIFNVADMCVVGAACLIALLSIRGIGIDGSRANNDTTTNRRDGESDRSDTDDA